MRKNILACSVQRRAYRSGCKCKDKKGFLVISFSFLVDSRFRGNDKKRVGMTDDGGKR